MQVTLSRNAWHYKLQSLILGKPQFANFCPYFWLTIFCLIVSPFYFFGVGIRISGRAVWFYIGKPATRAFKACESVAIKTMESILTAFDILICRPLDRFFVGNLDAEQVLSIYKNSRDHLFENHDKKWSDDQLDREFRKRLNWNGSDTRKEMMLADQKFQTWKQLAGPSWQEQLAELKKLREALKVEQAKIEHEAWLVKLERERKQREARIKREARVRAFQLQVVKVTRFVVPVLAVIAGALVVLTMGVVLFALGKFLFSLDWHAVGRGVMTFGKWAGIILLGLGVLVGVIALTVVLVKKCSLIIPKRLSKPFVWFGRGVVKGGRGVGRGFKWFGKALIAPPKAVLEFVIDYIKIAKKDHCPAIIWED